MKKILSISVALILMAAAVLAIPLTLPQEAVQAADLPQDTIVLYVGSALAVAGDTVVQVDEDEDVAPFLDAASRTLVPIRFISENFGAIVHWAENTQTVTITGGGKTVVLVVGKNEITVDGVATSMDTATVIKADRTFVPIRFVAEALGKEVFYDRNLIVLSNQKNILDPAKDKTTIDALIKKVNTIPAIDTLENFKKIVGTGVDTEAYLANYNRGGGGGGYGYATGGMGGDIVLYSVMEDAAMPMPAATPAPEAQREPAVETESAANMKLSAAADLGAADDFSTTNTQVQGVDEADIVKTDGEYIYHVNPYGILTISRAYPAEKLEKIAEVNFESTPFTPTEMYLDKNTLTLIGQAYLTNDKPYSSDTAEDKKMMYDPYYYGGMSVVRSIVFDISNLSDKSAPGEVRRVDIEGSYISSRKIGGNIYIATNKYMNYGIIEPFFAWEEDPERAEKLEIPRCGVDDLTPYYADGGAGTSGDVSGNLPLTKVRCFPNPYDYNYLVIGAFNIEKPNVPVNVEAYMGAGDNVYVSQNNMFVARTSWSYEPTTKIYKFALGDATTEFVAKGSVPGRILNQFSMDEYGGYFRIATTSYDSNARFGGVESNNVFVLDGNMNLCGELTEIAPNESIYSTRFMGEKLYMVTFKKVDPLFVISLSDPKNPQILGKLKIPGYSDYLHPYDENHIIGFGKDTEEAKEGDFAWYQGFKMAIFDVTDVENPIEMFVETIGDRGTDSPLLYNHKALLFSRERNLLAFPITIMRKSANQTRDNDYGSFEFNGALVYDIDLENGFTPRGRITHLSSDDYKKAGSYWYDSDKNIERILYIKDVLYGISNTQLSAHKLDTVEEIKKITTVTR